MDTLRWGIASNANLARTKVVHGMRKARWCEALASWVGAAPGA
jgi:hypothetical protein